MITQPEEAREVVFLLGKAAVFEPEQVLRLVDRHWVAEERCLRFFEAAARHRSFVRAAEELGVTPPAVAHRIRMLESHLGAELFERRRRGVYINRRGRAYYEEVRRILLDIHETTERHGTPACLQRADVR